MNFHEIKSFTVKKQQQNLLNFKTVTLKKDSSKNGQKLVGKILRCLFTLTFRKH